MHRSDLMSIKLAVIATLAGVALTAGVSTASASSSCGVYVAGGKGWIIVVKSVTCTKAKAVVRSFAPRNVALHSGQRRIVTTPLLPQFTCVLANRGKPAGSCSTAGAARSIVWIVA